ncbi:hypothetical protein [Streptomyces platensis]|uniref:hypothetical protein n=1 Tax=Streptomyces platensis TaxID=58346 RepID=UPI001F3EF732|nr:hypothetical protein [Streptomyces platensis]MCF3145766.1 hypothetical protein [Streptomyces platensis]
MSVHELEPEELHLITQQTLEVITSSAFVAAVRAVSSAPADQRLLEGSQRLSPGVLREQGVDLPSDMRISSRYFEEGLPSSIEFGDGPCGQPNTINALNQAAPGALDRIRKSDPDLFRRLVELADEESLDAMRDARIGGCSCAGKNGTCAGIGTGLA